MIWPPSSGAFGSLEAAHRLAQGDFSTRIQPLHGLDRMNEFDAIIADFNTMAEELSGIETLRTDFITNVSHELKTPLRSCKATPSPQIFALSQELLGGE